MIPKTEKEINTLLQTRKLEDAKLIKSIEKILAQKRGYVIKKPKPNSHVILLASGGLDSTACWAYLMKKYQLHVHPLFLNRGQDRYMFENESIDFFSKYFKEKHPKYWREIYKINAFVPPKEIRSELIKVSNNKINNLGQVQGIPVYTNFLFSYATQYAVFLSVTQNIKIRNIFTGNMAEDGLIMKDETLTAMRANNLVICSLMNDFSWQTIALPLEKELGFFHSKAEFLEWAYSEEIPIIKARSCIKGGRIHCGECVSCFIRKKSHLSIGKEDKTVYKQKGLIRGWEK